MEEHRPLEVRVTTVETKVDDLRDDVRTLVAESRRTNESIHELGQAVLKAASPKPMNLTSMVSVAGFVMAVGAATLSPMWFRIGVLEAQQGLAAQQGEKNIDKLDSKITDQTRLAAELVKETAVATQKQIDELREHGSINTRERLAVIESRLGQPAPPR